MDTSIFTEYYDTSKLPFMSSLVPSCLYIVAYLYIIFEWGPKFMKDREPYNLKIFLAVYNIGQVIACACFIYNMFQTDFSIDYLWKCYPVGFSNHVQAKLLYFSWCVKGAEFIETVCFVLRKKNNQISFLHIYHHISSFLFSYYAVRVVGNGMLLFTISLNHGVHVIMYSYYFVSLYHNDLNKIILVKKSITIMQMVQFTLILFNLYRAWLTDCKIPGPFMLFFVANILIIYYSFYEFYKKSYRKKVHPQKAN